MRDDDFEWDSTKAVRNLLKHGVSFERARETFDDAFAVEWADKAPYRGERRHVTVGMAGDRVLYVAYTFRGSVIRIISARIAEPYERRRYRNDSQS